MESALVTAVVDLNAISKNVSGLKALTRTGTTFMAVVKADGYGHGAVAVAEKALESGASWLGVARFHEAVELRNAGIQAPILVFGYVDPSYVGQAVNLGLTLTVYDLNMARIFSVESEKLKKILRVHLKVDTGMGRVGMVIPDPGDEKKHRAAVKAVEQIKTLPGIELEGMYTHFAAADRTDKSYTQKQIHRFDALRSNLSGQGIRIKICHAANSAGIIEFPQAHYDMVRAGISLYGLYPSDEVDSNKVKLFPAMTLTSIVSLVKKVPKGFKVSYSMTYETSKPTVLASVPIGYADGYPRIFSNKGCMLVNGMRAPIVGRVCMDQTIIDVGHIPDVKPGDPVVVFGNQDTETLSADELAAKIGAINYEIVSTLTRRVERVYSDSGSG